MTVNYDKKSKTYDVKFGIKTESSALDKCEKDCAKKKYYSRVQLYLKQIGEYYMTEYTKRLQSAWDKTQN